MDKINVGWAHGPTKELKLYENLMLGHGPNLQAQVNQ